jgi:polysaccharide export outer membrane protein
MKPLIRIQLFAVCLLLIVSATPALADYEIGVDDVLNVSFWQEPGLNEQVIVKSDGKITLSVIGDITAAGLTSSELSRKIVEQVSRFNRDITQAAVTVIEYGSQTVFVQGQIANPGPYAREVIPDMWTIIKERGGVTEIGDLSRVQLIRGGAVNPGEVLTVNVLDAVSEQNMAKLPRVYPRDIIRVPATVGGVPRTEIPQRPEVRQNVYYVLGAVGSPGVYSWQEGMDVLEALALAGGTAPDADLKKITVRDKSGSYSTVYKSDLDNQIDKGTPQRYLLSKENAIVVPRRGGTFMGVGFNVFRDVLALAGTLTSTFLLIDRFSD